VLDVFGASNKTAVQISKLASRHKRQFTLAFEESMSPPSNSFSVDGARKCGEHSCRQTGCLDRSINLVLPVAYGTALSLYVRRDEIFVDFLHTSALTMRGGLGGTLRLPSLSSGEKLYCLFFADHSTLEADLQTVPTENPV
jgi:hypothetical protein